MFDCISFALSYEHQFHVVVVVFRAEVVPTSFLPRTRFELRSSTTDIKIKNYQPDFQLMLKVN